jgi:hypothetical protein
MKFIIIFAFLLTFPFTSQAAEIIKIYSPYSPAHSATPALRKIIDEANQSQEKFRFLLEFKPGGNQIIALKTIEKDSSSLAIIAPAFVENVDSGKIIESDYRPVYALGDACWAVITNKPFQDSNEFVVGGVGYGNAAHLTSLALGEKYKFSVRYIIFKSNYDALVNMAGNNGIEFVIDRFEGYSNLKDQNEKLKVVAASCPNRLPQAPEIPTLSEMGIKAPYIFNIIVAYKDMPEAKRQEIGKILDSATLKIGQNEIFKISSLRPPIFDNVSAEAFYQRSILLIRSLQSKYRMQIEESKK